MYESTRTKGSVKFTFRPIGATKSVRLAGEFSGWQPLDMKKQRDGTFMVTTSVAKRPSQYKFIVDGQWMVDPDHNVCARNPFGSLNSVVQTA